MAETLTFDNTQEATTAENLSSEEQDSLAVGEQMQAEQEQLLAGKYKDAEELESAYIELQKKLGEKSSENSGEVREPKASTEEEPKEKTEETKKNNPKTNVLDQLWEESLTGEKVSKEVLENLAKSKPQDLAKMYLQYRNKTQPRQLSEKDITSLKNVAGGEQGYSDMLQWAEKSLNKQEIDMFDTVMERGDPLAAFFAVRSLSYRYNDSRGVDGRMVTGKAPKQNADQYRSQAEVVQAMSDPRYDRDPAYRNDVMKKLERSNVKF